MSVYANMDLCGELRLVNNLGQMLPVRIQSIEISSGCYPEFSGLIVSDNVRLIGRDKNSAIKKVIFNDPATIVIWSDNSKTVVKCQPGDTYSKEVGLAMCIAKKYLGNEFKREFKKWVPKNIPNIKTKVDRLIEYCDNRNCTGCPLDDYDCDFNNDNCIEKMYKKVFGDKEA